MNTLRSSSDKWNVTRVGQVLITLASLLTADLVAAECAPREFSSYEQAMHSVYIAYYGRPADPGGLSYWASRLEDEGGDLSSIIDAFGVSAEYDSRFGSLDSTELVINLYQQLFGRSPEPEGLNFYVNSLESGERNLQSISLDILYGAQNNDATTIANRRLVSQHYVSELERWDAAGVTISADLLASLVANVDHLDANAAEACNDASALIADALGGSDSNRRIMPEDLVYRGAFRLPEASNASSWEYSGYAMTYYPSGDPGGTEDGYPGSLFAVGHDQQQQVSEISIPAPTVSADKSVGDLNTATTLQGFQDIINGYFGELEIPRAGMAYLPAQGTQQTDKLHFAWGQHFQDGDTTHGWSELDLSNPLVQGPWYFGDYANYATNDYLFDIPASWVQANAPKQLLAAGRFRDGDWSGHGPSLFAYMPWQEDEPPAPGATITDITPLLLYGIQEPGAIEITTDDSMAMESFSRADEWSGGAWLTRGDKAAVIFVGTKGLGDTWYGYSNGVEYPISGDPDDEIPPLPDWPHNDRGWWSTSIQAQIIFFDPADLARVAAGELQPWEPQPYATMNIDPILFNSGYNFERGKRYLVGAAAFDRENELLYVMERLADGDKSLVHVWALAN